MAIHHKGNYAGKDTIMTTHWFRLLVFTGIGILLLGLAGWQFSMTAPPEFIGYGEIDLPVPILTARQYEEVIATHERPYVYDLQTATGAALIYGAEHTVDPADSQIAYLRQRWAVFRPSVALVEGRMGFLPPLVANPIRQFGESGLVYQLAEDARARIYTWEPPLAAELAFVLAEYPKERVALFYILRPYFGNLRHGRPADPEGFVNEYLRKRTQWPGLENAFNDMAELEALWQGDFPGLDWRDESDEDGLPGYLNEIALRSGTARDEHLVRLIIHLVGQGERVFAVMGSSHAVKIESALRAVLS